MKKQEEAEQQTTTQASSLADPVQAKESDDKAHAIIRKMMNSVFMKLDALSNFHYTPKMVLIITNSYKRDPFSWLGVLKYLFYRDSLKLFQDFCRFLCFLRYFWSI